MVTAIKDRDGRYWEECSVCEGHGKVLHECDAGLGDRHVEHKDNDPVRKWGTGKQLVQCRTCERYWIVWWVDRDADESWEAPDPVLVGEEPPVNFSEVMDLRRRT